MESKIKNIIFDLGGVLFDIDYTRTKTAFKEFGINKFEDRFNSKKQDQLFDLYETGHISTSNFLKTLKESFPTIISEKEIIQAWNAMLLNLAKENLDILIKLKANYRIFLLTNTNPLHEKALKKIIENQYGWNNFIKLFEKVYFSFQIGMRKPSKEIFKMVINENNLVPSETLFVDDSQQNVDGARKSDLNAILVSRNNFNKKISMLLLK